MFIASAALALIVGVVFAVLLDSIGDLKGAQQKAQHSEAVLAAANQLEVAVLDLETGDRGYIITHETRFLAPWTAGLAAFPREGAALESLVVDNPAQETRARALVSAGRQYISRYSKPSVSLARHNAAAARALVASGEGKRRVDALRAQFNQFVAAEDLLLVARRSEATSSANEATAAGVGGLIGATLLILLFASYLARLVAGPVRRTSAAAALFADGDLSVRVPEEGSGEVAELGRSFNTMARAISRDVVERDRAELARERLQEQLRQSQKMEAVGSLAGGIAHDFNNLLMVIRGYTDIVIKRNADERLTDGLTHINDAAERATELTRQLLAYSRQQVLRLETANLNDVVTDTLKLLDRVIGTDIEITADLEPGLLPITIDRSQLGQVILNLAVNAREAMPGGGNLQIRTANLTLDDSYISAHMEIAPGSYALLQVTDTGLGMDEPTRSRVFDPFFTTKSEGTGLGLATVYGIVKQSGGHILVYSETGLGTTFKLYFPHEATATIAALPPPEPTSLRGDETILLVEDDRIVRPLVTQILETYGYAVLPAGDGREAIAIAEHRDGSIDLLLTDIVMPGMNGRELADTLTAEYPALKVVFTSGYPANATVRNGLRDTDVAFIEKPYQADDLARIVRRVVDAPVP